MKINENAYNYDLQETMCLNYYARILPFPLFLPEAYTADPEYLWLLSLVEVEVVFIGNTIGVSTPFGIVDAS